MTIYRRLYHHYIEPRPSDISTHSREVVLNWLLIGAIGLTALAFLNVLVSYVIGDKYTFTRLIIIFGLLVFFYLLLHASRQRQRNILPSIVLLAIFFIAASWMIYEWGILIPAGVLLFSLVIVMGGILLSARFAVYMAILTVVVFSAMEYAKSQHYITPDISWQRQASNFTDVVGYAAIYGIIALVSWLFNRQMEASLDRAQRSEIALQRQKELLEVKAEKRAQQLEAAQLDKMQELYRFAELGRLSTALFHDLANHLSTVSLDIEGLPGKDQPEITQRISQNIGHIDTIVQRVRQQIRGKNNIEVFNVLDEIDEVLKILQPMAEQASVQIKLAVPATVKRNLSYTGDIVRFRQIIMNLVSNGIEAYTLKHTDRERAVTIALERRRSALSITVSDQGIGILPAEQDKIFRPFYTTKQGGTGIGLFIVQQVIEHDFGGQLKLVDDPKKTVFRVTLPKSYYARG